MIPIRIVTRSHFNQSTERQVYVATIVQGGIEFGWDGANRREAIRAAVRLWRRSRGLRLHREWDPNMLEGV